MTAVKHPITLSQREIKDMEFLAQSHSQVQGGTESDGCSSGFFTLLGTFLCC